MSAPPRPPAWEERLANRLLWTFAPPLPRRALPPPPDALRPFERVRVPRADGATLEGTWYPAPGDARGAVYLAHPWVEWGETYFHRRGRIEALRGAGYHVLTVNVFGLGASPRARGFGDRDVNAALDALAARAPGLPLHAWGVSSGGYWLHPALAARSDVGAVVFEDVSPHLMEWTGHHTPRMRGAHRAFARLVPRAERYLDMRNHAPHFRVRRAAYVGGDRDPGIPAEDTRGLAKLAGADCLIVPGAGHLAAIKEANAGVIRLALATIAAGASG